MAFRRRRRKRPVAWLPNTTDNPLTAIVGGIAVPQAQFGISTTIHALTVDYPAEAIQAAGPQPPSIADYVQSGYRVERIVGSFFAGMRQLIGDGVQTSYPESCLLAIGLIVLRVDELTGAPLRALTPNEYSPLIDDNERDPFFFRRSWVLVDDLALGTATNQLNGLATLPRANSPYGGGGMDACGVDTNTRRLVRTEERIFLVVSAANIGTAGATAPGSIEYCFDYRTLAVPRIMSNRNNASR